ncbi:YciI family protein [Agrococcus lahaulensis]|uniref:YciI family protein n=1 Tax=Agrococcus lahaulensis TaxID=341722 RepID=UPI00054DD909|nr:YciI family protein [Agrococcus lahaulensis]
MARYMLSVFGPAEREPFGEYGSREAMGQALADTGAFNERLERDGHFVFADGLAEATSATTVDGRGERPIVTDGPYLESKEHLGGFWVIEAADLDEAIALAAEGSRACRNPIEVRPFNSAESVRATLDA